MLPMIKNDNDMTEVQHLRAQLETTQQALQEFMYTISHDFGAPLRAVTSFSAILQQKYAHVLDEKAVMYLSYITEGGNKAQMMLAGLLEYSRIQTQAKPSHPTKVENILTAVCNELDEKIFAAGATIDHSFLPSVIVDSDQIKQLFHIVLDNALTYRRAGVLPRITIAAKDAEDFWRFTITDNGIGISDTNTERVFQIFKRLHPDNVYPGIGMGLTIARRIVERHGGSMGIKPAAPHGTTVWFTLPKNVVEDLYLAEI